MFRIDVGRSSLVTREEAARKCWCQGISGRSDVGEEEPTVVPKRIRERVESRMEAWSVSRASDSQRLEMVAYR